METGEQIIARLIEAGVCTAEELEALRSRAVAALRPGATIDSPPMTEQEAVPGHEALHEIEAIANRSGGIVNTDELRRALLGEPALV